MLISRATAAATALLLSISPAVTAQDSAADAAPPDTSELSPVAIDSTSTAAADAAAPQAIRSVSGSVEEVVVTAQKRAQSINDVSIAISAFSGEDLAALGVTDTRDLNALVPGFTYADSGFNTPVYTLRGIGFNEASQTASSTVGIYVDEFNLPFPVMSKGANLDLERVEVLKGPQGTLYGRNTTGGAVNYIAKKPTDSFEAGVTGTYGSYETGDVEAYVSGPLGDSLKARLAARTVNSGEGWQYSITRPEDNLGRKNKQSARLGLDWTATDDLSVRLTVDGWRDEGEPQAPQAVYIRAQNPILGNAALHQQVSSAPLVPANTDDPRVADWTTGLDYQLHDRFVMGALRSDWAFSDTTTLTALGSLAQFRSNGSTLPQSGTAVQFLTDRVIDVDTDASNLELRLSGNPADDFNWLAGLFVSSDKVSEIQDYYTGKVSAVFPLPGELGSPIADRLVLLGNQKADTQAVFGNAEWQFTEALKATLGARYTREKREFSGCSADSPDRTSGVGFGTLFNLTSLLSIDTPQELLGLIGNLDQNAMPSQGDCFTTDVDTGRPGLARPDPLDEDNVSGRAALDWKPDPLSLFYVSYSRGFKSGSFPILSSSRSDQYEPATQEQLDAYEVGAKNTLLDGLLQANGALFYYDYRDKQLLSHIKDPVFGPLPVLANAPKSRVLGAELELQSNPFEGLFVSLSGTYLDTEILEFNGIDNDGAAADYSGERFNFTPKFSYTALANYNIPLASSLLLTLGADYSHTSATNAQLGDDPRFAQPAYGLVNARVSLGPTDGRWKAMLFGRNLLDEYYVVGVFNPGDTIGRYTGMPRTVGLTLTYRYF